MLTPDQRLSIAALYAQRVQMRPLGMRPTTRLQRPARAAQVFQLERVAQNVYYLIPQSPQTLPAPVPHGRFVFVVLVEDPGRIYCAVSRGNYVVGGSRRDLVVRGHTSLTRGADVLFAGELVFLHGELFYWSNDSGHYRPPESVRHFNLIGAVRRLLPESKFRANEFH